MAAREVTDADGTAWTCVEAYAGLGEGAAAEAADRAGGAVTVVCTPSGGARSVRLTLAPGWDAGDDASLLGAITGAQTDQA